jgi:type I restriction enzyme S subunit
MSEISLPEHWKTEKLGQLCRVFSGYGFKTKDYTKEGIPLIKIGNLQDGEVIINPDNNYIPESWQQDEKLQRFILKSRDILIALTGMTGKTAVVPPSLAGAFLNQRVGKIELTSPDAEQDFILAVTKTRLFQEAIQQNTFRSVQGNISPSSISQISIPLPPLPEQRAIARVLRTVQEAKTARQRELALERERKAALMDYLFSYGTKGEPRKQTEIGEIPESWEVVGLETVLENIQYGLSAKANLKKQGYPLLRMNNLVDGLVGISDLKHIQLDKEELEKFRLNKGEVLFNRTNSFELVGKTGLFDKKGDYVFASYLIRLVTDVQRLNSYFLNFYFNWEATQTRLKRLSFRGAGQSNISASKLKMFKIPLPSLLEQQRIAEALRAFDTKIAALEQEAERLDELFHAMLDELMTGKRSAVSLIDAESVQSASSV